MHAGYRTISTSELRKCLARNPQERTETSAVGNDTIYRSCSLDHLLCGKTFACKSPALKSSAASPGVRVCRTYGRSFSLYSLETELSSHKAMYNTASSCPWTASKKIIFSFSFQTTFSPLVMQWLEGRFCERQNRKTFLWKPHGKESKLWIFFCFLGEWWHCSVTNLIQINESHLLILVKILDFRFVWERKVLYSHYYCVRRKQKSAAWSITQIRTFSQ